MTHRNPYRGNKMYGEDPAVAQIEVTNEDGVFFYTIDGIAPHYAKELDRLWAGWLSRSTARSRSWPPPGARTCKAGERLAEARSSAEHWSFNKVKRSRSRGPRPIAILLRAEQRVFPEDEGCPAGRRRAAADLRHRLVRRGHGLLSRTVLQRAGHGLHRPAPLLRRRPRRLANPAGDDLQLRVGADRAQAHPQAGHGARAGHALRHFRVGQRAAQPVAAGGPADHDLLRAVPQRLGGADPFRPGGRRAASAGSSSGCGRSTSPRPSANSRRWPRRSAAATSAKAPLVFARNLSEAKIFAPSR